MQMNCRLLLNLGLVCDLQLQESAAINYYKQVQNVSLTFFYYTECLILVLFPSPSM